MLSGTIITIIIYTLMLIIWSFDSEACEKVQKKKSRTAITKIKSKSKAKVRAKEKSMQVVQVTTENSQMEWPGSNPNSPYSDRVEEIERQPDSK